MKMSQRERRRSAGPTTILRAEDRLERPCLAIENPVTITDLHATLFTAMGMSPKTVFDIEGRPFYATEDGKGRAVEAIFGA